jgi:anthranilate phosphoribosyltransferase
MPIGNYIKEIGRGKDGARALSRTQATDLMGQVLDGGLSDLELGAFCIAMRIKGETAEEMAGFLDATEQRLARFDPPPASQHALPVVVIPSYNGARKLPVLTPLLALLLAQHGLAVLVHGTCTEPGRTDSGAVLARLGVPAQTSATRLVRGQVQFAPTGILHAGLQRLLEVRHSLKLRNPGHSLVKLMNPCSGPVVLVSSYTHPEYASSMAQTLALRNATALLLRGTEGEPVADLRRQPRMQLFPGGRLLQTLEAQTGSLADLPELPTHLDADDTARTIEAMLDGRVPLPAPIAQQVELILKLAGQS